ncbi:MAG: hypothetical protein Edafosvirus27_8 [Edafosvirus sp.]|uniref:Uncharacterized protein n=1 Tax=Edafosvirus sp. TaxID=2487765 RepID=A0A3G4ZZB4_9VIRU|nr:MAG: hypothetical protein Edafosvirus27_8 [Edafosvirus sp.]
MYRTNVKIENHNYYISFIYFSISMFMGLFQTKEIVQINHNPIPSKKIPPVTIYDLGNDIVGHISLYNDLVDQINTKKVAKIYSKIKYDNKQFIELVYKHVQKIGIIAEDDQFTYEKWDRYNCGCSIDDICINGIDYKIFRYWLRFQYLQPLKMIQPIYELCIKKSEWDYYCNNYKQLIFSIQHQLKKYEYNYDPTTIKKLKEIVNFKFWSIYRTYELYPISDDVFRFRFGHSYRYNQYNDYHEAGLHNNSLKKMFDKFAENNYKPIRKFVTLDFPLDKLNK